MRQNSLIYIGAEVVNKSLIFFTLPIFVRLLPIEDFGKLGGYSSLLGLTSVFMGLSLHHYVIRGISIDPSGFRKAQRKILYFSLSFVSLVAGVLLSLVVAGVPISTIFVYAVLSAGLGVFVQLMIGRLQALGQAVKSSIVLFTKNVLTLALALFLILSRDEEKFLGRIHSEVAVGVLLAIFAGFYLVKTSSKSNDKGALGEALKYSIPLLIGSLSGLALLNSDVLIVNSILGNASGGVYQFALSIAMVLYVIAGAINSAWMPLFYQNSHLEKKGVDAIQTFVRTNCKFVLVCLFFLCSFRNVIVTLVAPEAYGAASEIIPYIACGFFFLFVGNIYSVSSMKDGKTLVVSSIGLFVAVANVALNFASIPHFGLKGAAASSVFCYFLYMVFHFGFVWKRFGCDSLYAVRQIVTPVIVFLVLFISSEALRHLFARQGFIFPVFFFVSLISVYFLKDGLNYARARGLR